MAAHRSWVNFNRSFLDRLDWKRIKGEAFRTWAFTVRDPPESRVYIWRGHWRPLKDAESIPVEVAECFLEYVGDILKFKYSVDCRLSTAASPCAVPPKDGRKDIDVWGADSGWAALAQFFTRPLTVTEEAHCQRESELTLATRMIYETVGSLHFEGVHGDDAVEMAEREVLKRSPDEYTEMLYKLWRANEYTVMFGTRQEKGEEVRVGVSLLIPLIDDDRARFHAGGLEENDLDPANIPRHSRNLLLAALAENRPQLDMRVDPSARARALMTTLLYQAAAMLPPLHHRRSSPRITTFDGTPEAARRSRLYGFKETGGRTRLTDKAITEMTPPTWRGSAARYLMAKAQYGFFIALLQLFQAGIVARDGQLDD